MKRMIPAALIGGIAALGLVGCGSNSVSTPSSTLTNSATVDATTLATLADSMAADCVGQMNGHGAPHGLLPRLPGNVPSGCTLDAGTNRFVCTDENLDDGLTVDRSYAFFDVSGNAQSAYDAATTASINFQSVVSGTRSGDRGAGTVNNQRNLTASGLVGAETNWTWNGSGSGSEHREMYPGRGRGPGQGGPGEGGPGRGGPGRGGPGGGGPGGGPGGHGPGGPGRPDSLNVPAPTDTVIVDLAHSMTISSVVVPMPRTATSWPLSGSITQTMTAAITGGPQDGETRTRTVTITFDGTQYASVNDGTTTTTIDLANHGRPPRGGRR